MARPLKYDPDLVREQIMGAFWAKGYQATSLADLMAATNLQKGSLYAAYGDKHGMFQTALIHYDKLVISRTIETMDALPGQEALKALLAAPAEAVGANDRRGCLLCNSLGEYEGLDEAAKRLANRSRADLTAAIERALARLKTPPDLPKSQALELLAFYFGLRVLARGGVSLKDIGRASESALEKL